MSPGGALVNRHTVSPHPHQQPLPLYQQRQELRADDDDAASSPPSPQLLLPQEKPRAWGRFLDDFHGGEDRSIASPGSTCCFSFRGANDSGGGVVIRGAK